MTIGGYDFAFAGALEPERNANGSIREDRPQDRATKPLHKDGNGPFCRFRIELPKGVEGVYAFVVDGRVQYIGEAVDIRKRFNAGYGRIYTPNCEIHGRMTNCRINARVFHAAARGRRIELYLYPTNNRKAVEDELITRRKPPWNRKGVVQ